MGSDFAYQSVLNSKNESLPLAVSCMNTLLTKFGESGYCAHTRYVNFKSRYANCSAHHLAEEERVISVPVEIIVITFTSTNRF